MDAFANVEGGPLVAQLATISSPSTITLSNSATLTDSKANYFFASTKLDETRGVVVFVDTSQNNALIAASIEITNLPSMVYFLFLSYIPCFFFIKLSLLCLRSYVVGNSGSIIWLNSSIEFRRCQWSTSQ